MVKSSDFGDKTLEFKPQLHYLQAVCLWASYLTSLCLSGLLLSPSSWDFCKEVTKMHLRHNKCSWRFAIFIVFIIII